MSSEDQRNDLVAKLIGELKDLSLPKLQETLQEFLSDPEIGMTLRRLADDERADKEPDGIGTAVSPESRWKELEAATSNYEAKLHSAMKERVFGQVEPSLAGFQAYLEQLTKLASTSYEAKKTICKTVNYWKRSFDADFFHDGTACGVKAVSTRNGGGTFQLRATGVGQESLKCGLIFPHLDVQIRSADRSGPVLPPRHSTIGGVEATAPLAGREILFPFNQTTSRDLVNRLQDKMSLGEIARTLGRDTGYVSRIASGKRQPGEDMSIAIRQLALSKGVFKLTSEDSHRDQLLDMALPPLASVKFSTEIEGLATSNKLGAKVRAQERGLECTQRELEEKLHLAMVERVFGDSAPSLEGFQEYLLKIATSDMQLDGEPSLIVRTVNYCRQLPNVEADLYYLLATPPRGEQTVLPCRLKPLTGARYQLLGLGQLKDISLYNGKDFPSLIARPRDAAAKLKMPPNYRESNADRLDEAEHQAERSLAASRYRKMKVRVFGDSDPSVEGLQTYLNGLHDSSESTTFEQKRESCRTVKYWRDSQLLGVDLLYRGRVCGLSAKSNGGRGLYRIHIHGVVDPLLLPTMPKLICRKSG